MKKMRVPVIILAITLVLGTILSGCGKTDTKPDTKSGSVDTKDTIAVIAVKDFGNITVKLDPSQAPITVENFVKLAKEGFYNGLTFHRIIPNFMIQGGDPDGNGLGGSEKTIRGEFSSNSVANNISHVRGVISMARSKSPDSASSQFFITNADSTYLDGQYAAFGTVIEGMDVVDKISAVPTGENDLPVTPVVIESITIKQ